MAPFQTLIGALPVFLEETTSTNDALKVLYASQHLPEGTVLYTNFQQQGRGQLNAVWESEYGKNLLMSVLLQPTFLHADEQLWLNICICLAIRDCVEGFAHKPTFIKWPNDIYANDKKIAGILLENVLQGNKIKYTIAGIGLNINQLAFNCEKAISLASFNTNLFEVNEVRKQLCTSLQNYYALLKQKQWPQLWNLYHQYLYGRGEQAYFIWNDEQVEAQILGLDKQGRIHLLINDEIKSFAHKEIQFVKLK